MADWYHIYWAAWVIQFEIKDTSIEFVIYKVLPQGNSVKIKLNLKVEEIGRDYSPNFIVK